MRCPEENSTLRQERQETRPPSGTSIPSSHHPIAYLLSYFHCPRRYSHHWTQLSRASAPRLYNSLSSSPSVTRLASKGLGVDFFFPLYTLRGALCVFFRVLATATIEGESSRGQTRFLVPYLGFCSFVFFCGLPDLGRERQRERGREGGNMHDTLCIHIYIYLIEAMQSPRPCSSSSSYDYYYHYYWQNSSTIMWSAGAVLVALTGALIAATGRAFVIVVPRQATFCPGYSISNVQSGNTGLTADLSLAGPACNSYGSDIPSLKLMVNYDTGMDFFLLFFYLFT